MDRLPRLPPLPSSVPLSYALCGAAAALALGTLHGYASASHEAPLSLLWRTLFRAAVGLVPGGVVAKETDKIRASIAKDVIGTACAGEKPFPTLPAAGVPVGEVLSLIASHAAIDAAAWGGGKCSGALYRGPLPDALSADLGAVQSAAAAAYGLSNPLHPSLFPSLRKMESEVAAMVLPLFHAPEGAVASVTSGGTESILLAVRAFRVSAVARGVTSPNLVIPATAHAAFDKACDLFCIRLIKVPVDPVTKRAVPAAMEAAITPSTIGLVGSAVCFPNGVLDPIPELAAVAVRAGLPLHVDACLGSFLVALAGEAGHPLRHPIDFSVPGVSTISCDTHKYGYTPKGTSVLLYRDASLRHAQFFVVPDWTGGIYASPTLPGSRPGGPIAAAWATMITVGRDGYVDGARVILGAAAKLAAALRSRGPSLGLRLSGEPDLSVVAFESVGGALNVYDVADGMRSRGWHLTALQHPPGLHVCITLANAAQVEAEFMTDLEGAVAALAGGKGGGGVAAMYGMAGSIPDGSSTGLLGQVAWGFLDALTTVDDAGGAAK